MINKFGLNIYDESTETHYDDINLFAEVFVEAD